MPSSEKKMSLINFDDYCDHGKFSDTFKTLSWIFNGKLDYNEVYKDIIGNKFFIGKELNHRLSQTYKELLKERDINFQYDLHMAKKHAGWFLAHAIVKGDINSLDVLVQGENEFEKRQNFAVLLVLLQQYTDINCLVKSYTNSDFWGVIGSANLFDPMFQCFHYLHFFVNQKTKDGVKDFEFADITNLYKQGDIGTEEKITNTVKNVAQPLVAKLISFLKSDYFNDYFKDYFGTVEKRYNEVISGDWHTNLNENMMSDIYNSARSGSDNLLYQKLSILGFSSDNE